MEDIPFAMLPTAKLYGKCDHFTIEVEGEEIHCYVATEFKRNQVRSCIAARNGQKELILLTLPETSQRSQSWACGRGSLTCLATFAVFLASLGTYLVHGTYGGSAHESWRYILIWTGVALMIFFAFYAACYKHKASEEDREKYIQLLDEDDMLRSVLEQRRRNTPDQEDSPIDNLSGYQEHGPPRNPPGYPEWGTPRNPTVYQDWGTPRNAIVYQAWVQPTNTIIYQESFAPPPLPVEHIIQPPPIG